MQSVMQLVMQVVVLVMAVMNLEVVVGEVHSLNSQDGQHQQ